MRVGEEGQAFLETLLVLLVLCLALFGFLQIALFAGEREIVHHAASRAARAKAVGFNDWMALKAARVAAIPVSGKIKAEDAGWDGEGDLAAFELSRIPSYMASENHARAEYILNYEEWEKGKLKFSPGGTMFGNGILKARVEHDAPLRMPFAGHMVPWAERDEEGVPRVRTSSTVSAGEHSGLYLR